MTAATAELVADGGAAASGPEFFRSAEFLEAEGTTHTLLVAQLAIPLVVRDDLPGDLRDAISPYGYPGASSTADSPPQDPGQIDWSATGLVSVFIRDRVGGEAVFRGGTARSSVQLHDPARPRRLRPRLAEQIRAGAREGWEVDVVAGPATSAEQRRAFEHSYTQTMWRTGAGERYHFESGYFDAILAFERSWLLLARSPAGEPAAGAIAAASDGLLHYYLGGTHDAHLQASPFKQVMAAMLDHADRLDMPLNLGGGVHPGDGLERFKRGFANAEAPFHTHELVCHAGAYERLAGERPDTYGAVGFFPAYRAPSG